MLIKRLLCGWLAISSFSFAADGHKNITLHYSMTYNGIEIAEIRESLQFDSNGVYVIESYATPVGLASALNLSPQNRLSCGTVDDSGQLLVERFYYQRGNKKRASVVNREEGTVRLDNEGNISDYAIEDQTIIVDNLNVGYLFYVQGSLDNSLQINITDGRRVKAYEYRQVAEVALTVPAGKLETVKYDRVGDKKTNSVWFSPELNNLPVQLLLGEVEMQLVNIEYDEGVFDRIDCSILKLKDQ